MSFEKDEDAFNASCNISNIKICNSSIYGALCDTFPSKRLDIYKPAEYFGKKETVRTNEISTPRTPKPPQWLVATAKDENYNYFKFSKYMQKKVGNIRCGDITRFGKTSVLIRAKSTVQSVMLGHIAAEESEMLVGVKPHLNFSYARGVIFNRDLYEFSEEEILVMCPKQVWKVHKVPKTTMIIVTFEDNNIPSHISIENERIAVRPYKQKPLQCYNCFRYGHPSRVCKNDKLCGNCSAPAHGECLLTSKCVSCGERHKSTDKKCVFFQTENAALHKADAEHISVSYAKRLLNKSMNYSKAVKSNKFNSSSSHTDTQHKESRENADSKSGTMTKALPQNRKESFSGLGTEPKSSSPPHSKMSSPRLSSQTPSLPVLGEELSTGELVDTPLTPRRNLPSYPASPNSDIRRGSPPPFPLPPVRQGIETTNRFETLSSSPDAFREHKISVELHHLPHRFKKVHSVTSFKPRISRPSLTKKPLGGTSKTKVLPQRTSCKESFNK